MPGAYDIADSVRVTAEFRNNSGVLTDPTTVTLKVKTPEGTITTYVYNSGSEIVKSATGIYYSDIDITRVGTHHYRWVGTGTIKAAGESRFTIKHTEF